MKTNLKLAISAFVAAMGLFISQDVEAQNVIDLTAEKFYTEIFDLGEGEMGYLGDKPAIIEFTATWCGPCRAIAPILEELAAEYKDQIIIYKIDIDANRNIAERFNVTSIPAVMYVPLEGQPMMTVGSRNKAKFKSEIEKILLNN